MKARGDAIAVTLVFLGFHASIWRRPYTLYIGSVQQTFIRFNYRWWLVETGNTIYLDADNYVDYQSHPHRFNTLRRS